LNPVLPVHVNYSSSCVKRAHSPSVERVTLHVRCNGKFRSPFFALRVFRVRKSFIAAFSRYFLLLETSVWKVAKGSCRDWCHDREVEGGGWHFDVVDKTTRRNFEAALTCVSSIGTRTRTTH
jgi:hypothetical protein